MAMGKLMKKPASRLFPSLSIRIDLNPGERIGPGKIQLLESIQSCGSISAAGRALGMSYKRAWDLVDEINRICNQIVVERQVGGKHGGGAVLTRFGALLVDQYREIEAAAENASRQRLKVLKANFARPRKRAARGKAS
jgi:molybdate transport system regulatory protein